MRWLWLIVAMVSALPVAVASEKFPAGWQLAAQSPGSVVEGQFLANGKLATAGLFFDKNGTAKAFVRRQGNKQWVEFAECRHEAADCSLSLLSPGTYRTACGKGFFDCGSGERETFTSRYPVLVLTDGDVQVAFVFQSTGIKRIWLTD